MTIHIVKGDLLDSPASVIIHQTNCTFGFGSGVAKAIKEKWPIVAEKYHKACAKNQEGGNPSSALLGKIQPVPVNDKQVIINMFAQDNYGYDGARYTSYDALDMCLKKVKEYCLKRDIKTIALPFNMSSDRGGADWDVVVAILKSNFRETDIDIEIKKL